MKTLERLKADNLIVFTYVDPQTRLPASAYPDNPNGSQMSIAGVCDSSGRLFGLMPHPEAYNHRTNHPRWTREKLPEEGLGCVIFNNAYAYVKKHS
jgi:phosphoribosylformylglycinamidine synthase